jgi:hypothetical protein
MKTNKGKGVASVVGFVTALLTFFAVVLQGVQQYQKEHPVVEQKQVQSIQQPYYWYDQRTNQWFCCANNQVYVWRQR